jgi:hypothetical protein
MIWADTQIISELKELREMIEKKPDKLEKDAYERLADLEVKMAKLWEALLTTTVTGRVKTTKLGRRFGGVIGQNQ